MIFSVSATVKERILESQVLTLPYKGMKTSEKVDQSFLIFETDKLIGMPTESNSELFPITSKEPMDSVKITIEPLDPNKEIFIFAVYRNEDEIITHNTNLRQEDGTYNLPIPIKEGKVDFLACIFPPMFDEDGNIIPLEKDDREVVFFNKEDVDIELLSSGVVMRLAEAKYNTEVIRKAPDGTILILPEEFGSDDGNCCAESVVTALSYKGYPYSCLISDYVFSRVDKVRSNFIESYFSITQMYWNSTYDFGICCETLPIDFSQPNVGPDDNNWLSSRESFSPTPMNNSWINLVNQLGAEDMLINPSSYYFLVNGECLIRIVWSTPCEVGYLNMWEPVEYNGPYQMALQASGMSILDSESSIWALPIIRSSNSLKQVGLNIALNDMGQPDLQLNFNEGNPVFSVEPSERDFGNCAPAIIIIPYEKGFAYNFSGRYGEAINVDSWNVMYEFDSDIVEILGGQPSSIKIFNNEKLICDGRENLGVNWGDANGEYLAEIETRNILVDGELPGYSKATLSYRGDQGYVPTVTQLSFCKEDGDFTDRFKDASEGKLIVYVAGLKYEGDTYDIKPVSDVIIEYAPIDSEDFSELIVVEDPSKFFSPGYGYYYSATLGDVKRYSYNGWYKLRITVKCSDGAYMQQEISPAFKIDKLSHIEPIISSEEVMVYKNDIVAPAGSRIYNIGGAEVGNKLLPKGIYLVVTPEKTIKVAVR